jgi:cation diffusion facilitator CzcD-associated flavoprotein CzcO
MVEAVTKTDVIIVGAGPTGLSLTVQLMRYGIDFVIFDKKEGVTDLSKALVVHARLRFTTRLGWRKKLSLAARSCRKVP